MFFGYAYSQACLAAVKLWLGIGSNRTDIGLLCAWIARQKRSKFLKNVQYAGVCACAHMMWKARNEGLWNLRIPTIDSTVRMIKHDVRNRISLIYPKKVSSQDRLWFDAL